MEDAEAKPHFVLRFRIFSGFDEERHLERVNLNVRLILQPCLGIMYASISCTNRLACNLYVHGIFRIA